MKSLPEHNAVHTSSYDPTELEVSTKSTMVVPDVSRASTNLPNMTGTGVEQESSESGPAESPIAPSASHLWPADTRSTKQGLLCTFRPEEAPPDSYSSMTNYLTGAFFTSVKVEQDFVPTVTSVGSTATAARGRTSESQNLGLNQNRPNLSGTTSANSTAMNSTSGNSMTANSSTGNFSASLRLL